MQLLAKLSDWFSFERKGAALTIGNFSFERFTLARRGHSFFSETKLLEAYRAHELVYACINKLADVMNDTEIIVTENKNGEWKKKEGHLLPALFKRPNPYETGRDFRRLMIQSEQTAGIFYGEILRSGAGIPVEIHPLNPNRVEPKLNQAKDGISHYEYTKSDGGKYNILPENMMIRRRSDLTNRFFGLSPLAVALKSINSDLGFTDYVDAFFESDGTPSGILKILSGNVDKPKREAMQADWQRKYSRGGSNQKGVAVLDQNAEFQRIGSNLNELAADSISDRFESRICAVFGVPPNLVGANVGLRHVTANATAKAELRNFWDNKVSPELAVLREWLTWFVLPEFESIDLIKAEKVRVEFDISQCAFLQEDLNDIQTRARENFLTGGITLNEFRQQINLPPDTKGDYYIRLYTRQPITADAAAQIAEIAAVPQNIQDASQIDENAATEGASSTDDDEKRAIQEENNRKLSELFSEKKTFDLDGLMLSREPRGVETVINLKSLVSDFETEKQKAVKILNQFRTELINSAVKEIEKLEPATIHTLVLQPNQKTLKQIGKTLQSSYERGRAQIVDELNAQKSAKSLAGTVETKDTFDDDDFIKRLAELTISKIINEIQSRAINIFVSLWTLKDFTIDLLRDSLLGESTKFVEQLAGNSVNAAIRTGRIDEIMTLKDEWKFVEYSAILDVNTCDACAEWDGRTADTPDDLPDAPNPECAGGVQCRCFIVCVIE